MPVVGITGGISSGKSTVAKLLIENLKSFGIDKVERFSADDCSHQLMDADPEVRELISQKFGPDSILKSSMINRPALREIVFADSARRKLLESILHPKIHQVWQKKAKDFRSTTCYFIAEIPLLYETKSESHFDVVLVVETDPRVQCKRLAEKRGWSVETAIQAIGAQMPASEKMRLANIIILNQYTEELLLKQVQLAAHTLLTQYV